MSKEVMIDGIKIGANHPPYIISELSANHNGSIDRALEMIEISKKCGAQAIKIQTYTPDTMTLKCDKPDFVIDDGLWKGYNLYDLYAEAQTPFEWHQILFAHAKKLGITIFSTPFDESAVDLLESLNVCAYKVASFEAIDIPLIKYIAQKHKPMIISTGMANFEEIAEALEAARSMGAKDIVVLHCISAYPTPIDSANLRTIADLAQQFNVISGLSDHTLGTVVPISAVALGANVIEKHFCLSRQDKGPDADFSLEPDELAQLCQDSKNAWLALGKASYERKSIEETMIKFRRSIYVAEDIKQGEIFTTNNIRRVRPGLGLAPKYYEQILGKTATQDLELGTPLTLDHVKE